ncbi:MAG: hypothetical protein JW909_10725 [Planctomycetes bacterium]|nr:hypothetical protein [Planctomycetota bacterium]
MPEGGRRPRRVRKALCAFTVVIVTVSLILGTTFAIRYGYRLMKTRWLKSDSGKMYTPGGAAKKVIEKVKE